MKYAWDRGPGYASFVLHWCGSFLETLYDTEVNTVQTIPQISHTQANTQFHAHPSRSADTHTVPETNSFGLFL
jgi:hypothetical protein